MKSPSSRLLIATLLATAGFSALAQAPQPGQSPVGPMGGGAMMQQHRGPMAGPQGQATDPAALQQRMRDRHTARMAVLKDRLKISASQEAAWAQFTQAAAPSAERMAQHQQRRAEMAKLTTPERIDRMRALREQHAADMTRRGDAVKTFYAQLNTDQQKVFDELSLRHGGRGGHDGRHGHGSGHGPRGGGHGMMHG
jgi:periplasmic protein CpxP/Spy